MKVLHFYKTYYPYSLGGVEQVIFQMNNGFSRLGIHSEVLALSPLDVSGVYQIGSNTAYFCPRDFQLASTDFSLSVFGKFKELAKEADIIHYHFPWPFMDLVHFFTNHNKPSVVTYHSDIVRQKFLLKFYRPIMSRFLKSVDAIIASSPNYLATSEVLRQHQNKVEVIPLGLDEGLYPRPHMDRISYWQERLGRKFFLFIGVLRYYKGLNILLDALVLGDLPTVIVGAGPIESELRAKAVKLGLKNVIFLGQVSDEDKVAILYLSYALIFPSHLRSEAFGMTLLEGAMFGKPLISSEIGTGTSFINLDRETGLIVPPSSPMDLHIALVYLWNSPETAKLMGVKSRERYLKLFTAEKMCKSYLDIYNRLLVKRR